MADEERYRRLAEEGESPEQVYRAMRADGLGWIAGVRILRELFQLSLERAKEVTVVADGLATSLGEHEARLVDEATRAIEESSEGDIEK